MAHIIIDPRDQSAPNWGLPKGFLWNIREEMVPVITKEGVQLLGRHKVRVRIAGSRESHGDRYGLVATFEWDPILDKKGQYRDRMMVATRGIAHDINIALEGGDCKGPANLLMDKMARKIAEETGIDPMIVNQDLQHQNVGEA